MQIRHHHSDLWNRVDKQAVETPAIFGRFDFTATPERFTTKASLERRPEFKDMVPELMEDEALVEMMAGYTFMGDPVADAYAARIPDLGFRTLIDMLQTACDKGLDAVPDAPPELTAFITAMENRPDWVDMDLVREGARVERNQYAHLTPFAIRGAFLATFMNRYSALPMALTGALSDKLAARRVHETASFFTLTVMPGALERNGAAFKAAAMVRLMHSMVRFNVMQRDGIWDTQTFGIPIPQVDQMPAGQIGSFLLAFKAIREGRDAFTPAEQARIEIARYRCFLLGLPEELLGETPHEITRLMLARQATLRNAFDDETCGALVRGTMNTQLSHDQSLGGKIDRTLERGFSKAYFIRHFLQGDTKRSKEIGVDYTLGDRLLALASVGRIYVPLQFYKLLAKIPYIREAADRRLIGKLNRLLERYGHAEFVTDGNNYRESHG
ncbi:oxygenase MpaB family protein [Parasphingorhabdus sp.]|uniref:oxygenase MpaB family protein n=1 Tax=Parasphingorhabdus sp. TaxID=2709688 RepID=UPI00326768BF